MMCAIYFCFFLLAFKMKWQKLPLNKLPFVIFSVLQSKIIPLYKETNILSTYICIFIVTVGGKKYFSYFLHPAQKQRQFSLKCNQDDERNSKHKHRSSSTWDGLCPNNTLNMAASLSLPKCAENIHYPTAGQNHLTQSLL